MQYVLDDPRRYITTIEFRNLTPIVNIERIHSFREEGQVGTFLKKEFEYSYDNVIWQPWQSLTNNNLHTVAFQDKINFYIHIKYTRASVASGNINAIYLNYDSGSISPPSPDASIHDADLLDGEDGEYYLTRANHIGPFGPFTDLNVYNVPDSSAPGVYDHREDASEGTNFYLKRIRGIRDAVVTEDSSGIITIAVDASGVESFYQNSDPVTQTVGGILSGQTFFDLGKDFKETMQAMFYPTLYPTLTNPSNTFIDNVANLQEIDTSINITFTSSFNRGSISPQYTSASQYRSGVGNTVYYTGYGLPADVSTSSSNIQTITGYEVLVGIQSWTSAWNYDEGVQPKDSEGNDYNSPLAAGTTSYKSTSFEGVYPILATTVDITTDTEQPLVSMLTGNNVELSLVPETGGDKQSFMVPSLWEITPTNRPVVGILTFNTVSGNWEYQGGSASTSLTFWNRTLTSKSSNPVYYRYTYTGDDRAATQITLVF